MVSNLAADDSGLITVDLPECMDNFSSIEIILSDINSVVSIPVNYNQLERVVRQNVQDLRLKEIKEVGKVYLTDRKITT